MEEFQDMVNQMLKDTYYHVSETRGLAWMNDYPQVMAGIHKQVLDNMIAVGRLSSNPSTDRILVDSHFSTEELEAIRHGYKLLAAEEVEEEAEGQGLAGLGEEPTTKLQGAGKGKPLSMLGTLIYTCYSDLFGDSILYCADATTSKCVPTPPPARDPM